MQRIVILGCAGSGKSTLARRLGRKLDLRVVHLDALYWLPGWTERPKDDFVSVVEQALSGDAWICEGGYSVTHPVSFPRAQLIVWLHRSRWLCMWRAIWRVVQYQGRANVRPDMGPDCPERVDLAFLAHIWTWEKRIRPRREAALAQYAAATPLIVLDSDAAVEAFLAGLDSR
jgi:adenylate kinase family enzyme